MTNTTPRVREEKQHHFGDISLGQGIGCFFFLLGIAAIIAVLMYFLTSLTVK